ncbi:hypothetical protein ACFE04_029519 [Oxalis oulophora]
MEVQNSGEEESSQLLEIDEDYNKLKQIIITEEEEQGTLQFDDWTSLISNHEQSYPDDIDKISVVYDSFLTEFPLCCGYWRKYVQHTVRLCSVDKVVDVFERAVRAATYSVHVWVDYCSFALLAFEDPNDIRRLFKRGLSVVGKDYLCHTLWDKYVKFEFSQQQWSSLAHIYLQTLKFPTKKLHHYYESFKKLVASLKEEMECCLDSNMEQESDLMLDCEKPSYYKDAEISIVISDLFNPSNELDGSRALQKYVSIGENFYKDACQLDKEIRDFEAHIKRPYYHVKPLDVGQLEAWHHYLNFVEIHGDFDWVVKLYERCLIPCVNYPEFWMRYVDFVETKGGREIAKFALARARKLFVKTVPEIHLFCARFNEQIGDISGSRDAFLQCDSESESSFVQKVTMRANMEKRLGNILEASNTYKEALEAAAVNNKLNALPTLYANFARFSYVNTDNADAARDILIDGIKCLPHCKLLIEELIKFAMMHGGARHLKLVDSIVASAIYTGSDGSKDLNAKDMEDLSVLYLQQFVDFVGNIDDVQKAWNRHRKFFPESMRLHMCKLQPMQEKPLRITIKEKQQNSLSLAKQQNGDSSPDKILTSLENHYTEVPAADDHLTEQKIKLLENHDIQPACATSNCLPSLKADNNLEDKSLHADSEGLEQILEETLELNVSVEKVSDEIKEICTPRELPEENNIQLRNNNTKTKQDLEPLLLEKLSLDLKDTTNPPGSTDTESQRSASPHKDAFSEGSFQKNQVSHETNILDESSLQTEIPQGPSVSNQGMLSCMENKERNHFTSSPMGIREPNPVQNQFGMDNPLSSANHQNGPIGEARSRSRTPAGGNWRQNGNRDRSQRDFRYGNRGRPHRKFHQQQRNSSQRQYPRAETAPQMVQNYPSQSSFSGNQQVQSSSQAQHQNPLSHAHTNPIDSSQARSMENFQQQQNFASSTFQSQQPHVHPVSYPPTQMSQYPMQSNDVAYNNQMWQVKIHLHLQVPVAAKSAASLRHLNRSQSLV